MRFIAAAIVLTLACACLRPARVEAGEATAHPRGPGSLSGVWTNADYPRGANFTPRAHVRRTVEGKLPPLQPWAAELLESRVKASESGRVFASPKSQCLPAGMPAMMFPAGQPLQFLETPGQVTILSEEPNFFRIIPLNAKHGEDPDPTFLGDSIGHWDGDTFIVDTIAVTTKVPIDAAGMPHSEQMHLVERFRRTDANTIELRITIDDPKTFTAPWTAITHYRLEPDRRVLQYFCENNRDLADPEGKLKARLPAP